MARGRRPQSETNSDSNGDAGCFTSPATSKKKKCLRPPVSGVQKIRAERIARNCHLIETEKLQLAIRWALLPRDSRGRPIGVKQLEIRSMVSPQYTSTNAWISPLCFELPRQVHRCSAWSERMLAYLAFSLSKCRRSLRRKQPRGTGTSHSKRWKRSWQIWASSCRTRRCGATVRMKGGIRAPRLEQCRCLQASTVRHV